MLRIVPSPGLKFKRSTIQSDELREDGDRSLGRLGNKTVSGSFNCELSAGGAIDTLLESAMRSTWTASAITTGTSMTTLVFATNTITAAAGNWTTQLVAIGDIVRVSGSAVTANHDLNIPVIGLSTLVITVPTGTFTVCTAAASASVTRLKKVYSASTPTKWSHTIEQVSQNIDASEYFLGCALVGAKFSFRPNQHATVTWTFAGINRTAVTATLSPYFTDPTTTTNLPLVADDGVVRYNGAAVATFTGFDLDLVIDGAGVGVIGSTTTPSIFLNRRVISASITALRSDFSNLTLFDAETEFAVSVLLQELETAPKSCLNFFLPRTKLVDVDADVGGGDGAQVETLQLMVAPKDATAFYDTSIMTISSSE